MSIELPPSALPGDTYSYAGRVWRRMNGYWTSVAQFNQPPHGFAPILTPGEYFEYSGPAAPPDHSTAGFIYV